MHDADNPDLTPTIARIMLGFLRWADVALEITIVVGAIALLLESCGVGVIR